MITQETQYIPDLPTPPGDTLLETLEARQMSQAELADRMGRPRKTINEIIRGKTSITPETALQLELVLGIPASFWNKREREYQEALARLQQQKLLENWMHWVDQIPYKELMRLQWVSPQTGSNEIVKSVLSFFGVVSPEQWQAVWDLKLNVAFRRSTAYSTDSFAVAAWLRRAELLAQDVACDEYDEGKFRRALDEIRSFTAEAPRTEIYQERLVDICRGCGVAVVIVPKISKTSVFGASQWLSPRKAMIVISLYYKTDDIFWYTFFHEAAHILFHSKKELHINLEDDQEYATSEVEKQANQFARDFLIPQNALSDFIRTRSLYQGEPFFDERDICRFAKQLGIAPSIVVGRLQFDGIMRPKFNNKLKTMLDSVGEAVVVKRAAITCND